LTGPELVALGNLSQFMAYGKHHLLIQEGTSIDKIYLIRSGWVRRVRGVPIYKEIAAGARAASSSLIPEDFSERAIALASKPSMDRPPGSTPQS
jgi:CRP-like cAMP-binding protein